MYFNLRHTHHCYNNKIPSFYHTGMEFDINISWPLFLIIFLSYINDNPLNLPQKSLIFSEIIFPTNFKIFTTSCQNVYYFTCCIVNTHKQAIHLLHVSDEQSTTI